MLHGTNGKTKKKQM